MLKALAILSTFVAMLLVPTVQYADAAPQILCGRIAGCKFERGGTGRIVCTPEQARKRGACRAGMRAAGLINLRNAGGRLQTVRRAKNFCECVRVGTKQLGYPASLSREHCRFHYAEQEC